MVVSEVGVFIFIFFDFFTNLGIPAGTCRDVRNEDGRKNSPIAGIGDGGEEGLRSRGREVGSGEALLAPAPRG